MTEQTVQLAKEVQKELIALGKNLGLDAKTELGPEFKKIYFEDYIQQYKEKHGDAEAQMMCMEILKARNFERLSRSDTTFLLQVESSGGIQISKDKEQYLKLYGWGKRLDDKGKSIDAEPLVVTAMVKGEENINRFQTVKTGDTLRAAFGVMRKNNYSMTLFRAPENLDEVLFDQDPVLAEEDAMAHVQKKVPIVNVSKVFDYSEQVVAIWAKPVVRCNVAKAKDFGVYEIVDDSVDRAFLTQYKALTIFTGAKNIKYGPGSHVLMVVELLKPKQQGAMPNANLLMQYSGQFTTPVLSKDSAPAKPKAPEGAGDVDDEELADSGLDQL